MLAKVRNASGRIGIFIIKYLTPAEQGIRFDTVKPVISLSFLSPTFHRITLIVNLFFLSEPIVKAL